MPNFRLVEMKQQKSMTDIILRQDTSNTDSQKNKMRILLDFSVIFLFFILFNPKYKEYVIEGQFSDLKNGE